MIDTVFQVLPKGALSSPTTDMSALLAEIPKLVAEKYERVVDIVEADYPADYLASPFKKASRCQDIASKV